jgi:RNA recognition motif-containing protein
METADYSGKLFVGGISWETDEDRLREYFGRFGEVTEAVIMRDRSTGRARGFGFVVFADATVAERVTIEKHMIDGRMVILPLRSFFCIANVHFYWNSVVKLLFFCLLCELNCPSGTGGGQEGCSQG